jgi:hypothetical protein
MMLVWLRRIYSFLRYNPNKFLYLQTLILSAINRMRVLIIPIKRLQRSMGVYNQESAKEESEERYRRASLVAYVVNRVCDRTPWKSRCLVKALTAQYLLKKKNIPSTLYLGVGKDGERMTAHAWLRTGRYYITGGSGEGLALVAKFRA